MSNILREKLADLVLEGIDNVHDMDVTHDAYAWSAADAILAALPEIVAGMVKPLEWVHRSDIPYLHNALGADGWWRNIRESCGRFILEANPITGTSEQVFQTIESAKAAANAHHTAKIMKALDLEPKP